MEAPRIPSMLKQNQHKRFEFKPRFYDERKERLEEMKKKYSGEANTHSANEFKGRMTSEWRSNRGRKSSGASVRLVVIAIGLFLITYLILFT